MILSLEILPENRSDLADDFVRLQEFDYPAASAIASVILAASLLLLFSINTLQSRFGRRVVGH